MNINPYMLVSSLIVGTISAFIAYRREKNPILWFFIGALFGLIGLFIFFFWSEKHKAKEKMEPNLVIQGPKDKFWYFLDESKTPQGPMSFDALSCDWKSGRLSSDTYVWHEDLTEWKQIKETLQPE